MEELGKLMQDCAAEMGVALANDAVARLLQYKDLLLEWNQKMNLTAITDSREVVLKHFADSMTALEVLPADKPLRVADVGTGAGFPGLPLAIAAPSWEVTLMDALQKRVKFLSAVTESLGMEKVACLHLRAEDAGQSPAHRARYDAVVSRAVARLSVLAEYALPLIQVGGTFVALKGPSVGDEVEDAKVAIQKLGGEFVEVKNAAIPFTEWQHTLVIIKKVRQTPTVFPRTAAQMAKGPIK